MLLGSCATSMPGAASAPMTHGDFSVTAAAAFVLGGVAALLLATVLALNGYGRAPKRAAAPHGAGATPSSLAAGGALSDFEIDYSLEGSEPGHESPGP